MNTPETRYSSDAETPDKKGDKHDESLNQKRKSSASEINPQQTEKKKEIGGRDGLDPTRYGDWESKGRCIDF